MVVTLDQLVSVPDLRLRRLAGTSDRPLTWVHSSDLADPTPFVGAGHLLLTTGTQFAHPRFDRDDRAEEFAPYVDRLVAAGVPGVGFGTEVVRSGTPAGLVAACVAADLPLVEVPYRTPFVAIVRWVADELADQRHARDGWALQAQRALSRAALTRGRLRAVVDELARQLSARVMLFDSQGAVVAGPRAAESDPVALEAGRLLRRRLRSGSAVEADGARTVLQTLGRRHELRGVLAVTPEAPLDSAATAVITSAVALAEFALEDAARQRGRAQTLNAELLTLVVDGEVDVVRRALAAGGQRMPDAPLRVLLTADDPAAELDGQLAAPAAEAGTVVFTAPWTGRTAVLVEASWSAVAVAIAKRRGLAVGVSRGVDLSGVGPALSQADRALSQAGPGTAVYADRDLDPLWGLLPRQQVADLAAARLRALDDDPQGAELRRTASAWLRHNAQWDPAARELGLHRHTVKAQLERVGALLDLPLHTFAGKAELWALLTAVG